MHIKEAHIQGYRSLRNVQLPFHRLTSLIGANGSGKSTILGAIRLFFEPRSGIDNLDFWCPKQGEDRVDFLSIRVTFTALSTDELARFGAHLDENHDLTVERRFDGPGSGAYVTQQLAVPEFSTIRRLTRGHREDYDRLRNSARFPGLPEVSNREKVFAAMKDWEQGHPGDCQLLFEPFEAIQELMRAVTFLFVGAFEEPSRHLDTAGSGSVMRLIEKLVDRTAIGLELEAIADQAVQKSADLLAAADQKLDNVAELMARQIESFAPGCGVQLAWDKGLNPYRASPTLSITFKNSDGLIRPLMYQGHGVQRSLMYAVLTSEVMAGGGESTTILIIEEPEAFQHPLSSRVLSRTLRDLSEKNHQVVYSTHSSQFIQPDQVEGLRIVRREDRDGTGAGSYVEALSGLKLLEQWERVFGGRDYTPETVSGRLNSHLSPHVLEGLFARWCIIVEGEEDEALIRGAATERGVTLDAHGVAIIRANGKGSIPSVLTFLLTAGVSCYPIFDLDRSKSDTKEQMRDSEEQILRALSIPGGVVSGVHQEYACWEDNFGKAVDAELGDGYTQMRCDASILYGYTQPTKGNKVTIVIAEALRRASEAGLRSPSLASLIDQISTNAGLGDQPNPLRTATE